MSKRKLSTEPRRGLNVLGERSNATNVRATAITDIAQRKLGTNVRPTSNYKFTRGRTAAKRSSGHDGFDVRRSSVARSQMVSIPKTRFSQTNGFAFRTARLGSIPAESCRHLKTSQTTPLHLDRELDDHKISVTVDGLPKGPDGISSPSHRSGCGDASVPSYVGEKSGECSQRVRRHAPEEITATSQKLFGKPEQSQPNGCDCDIIENATSPRRPVHRPSVSNPALSPRPTLPLTDTAACGQQRDQEDLKKVTTFGFEVEQSKVSARQETLQQPSRSVSNTPNQITDAAVRTKPPWIFDNYEDVPAGKFDTQRDTFDIRHSINKNHTVAENQSGPRPREENERDYTPQEQRQVHHQHQRWPNQQGGCNATAPQSSLQDYRLLQDNLFRQREMQRRACIEQKRMMFQAQQMRTSAPAPQTILCPNIDANQNQVPPRHTLAYQQNSLGQHCETDLQRATVHEHRAKNARRVTFDDGRERQRDDKIFQHQHQVEQGQETEGCRQQPHPMKEVRQRLNTRTQRSRIEGKKNPEFTVEMIRDQELLVANMRQQNIPDDIMRRQFNTLLADQRRYLAFLEEQRVPETSNVRQSRAVGKVSPRCQRTNSMERISHVDTAIHQNQSRGIDVNPDCRTGMSGQRSPVIPGNPSHRLQHRLYDHNLYSSELGPSQQQTITPQSYNNSTGITESSAHTSSRSPPVPGLSSSRTKVGQLMQYEFNNLHQDQTYQWPQHPGPTAFCEQHASKVESKEPSSLLKIREYNKYIRPQKQNNGLQELSSDTMEKASKCSGLNKNIGFDYLVGIDKKVATLKLNGAQDPSELEKIMPPPAECRQQQCSRVSANGLCNTRNSNNPAPASITVSLSKKTDDPAPFGYPRQYYPGEKGRADDAPSCNRKTIAEKPNCCVQGAMRNEYHGDIGDQSLVSSGHALGTHQWIHKTECATQSQVAGGYFKKNHEIDDSMKPPSCLPIMLNKLGGCSQPQYQQHLRKTDGCGDVGMTIHEPARAEVNTQNRQVTLLVGNGGGDIARPAKQDFRSDTCADVVPNEISPITNTGQSNCEPGDRERQPVAQDSLNVALCPTSEPGQPEIQEVRTIGGFRYLARRLNHIRQLSPIAPSTIKQSLQQVPSFLRVN